MNYDVINNEQGKRFEIHVDAKVAFEDYDYFTTHQGERGIAYLHTEVPPELGGRGIASYLIKYILDYAEQHGLKVKPICPLVKAYIDKHPEYQANSVYHQH
ncbi:MAG: N-acetyltransferase [Moraxellaceae bacterium]|nr:MAG: N-acetyltransferase [Moraxellaceae bacterium]